MIVNGKVLRQGGQSLKVEVAYACSAQCPRLARFSLSFLERPLRRINRLMVPNTFFMSSLAMSMSEDRRNLYPAGAAHFILFRFKWFELQAL